MTMTDHDLHFTGQVAQKALIRKDGQILLVQYPSTDMAAELWDMPGGRLHIDESPLAGLEREVREEIGAEIEVSKILATGRFVNLEKKENFFVIYEASLRNPAQDFVLETDEIGKVAWVGEAEFFTLPIIYTQYQEALRPVLAR
jgi:8-oxo-dGTP pyrophosphatase MutT (NUDIX family)